MRLMFGLGILFGVSLTGFLTALLMQLGELPAWPGVSAELALGLSGVMAIGAMVVSQLYLQSCEQRSA